MAGRKFGKTSETSSSSEIPLTRRSKTLNPRVEQLGNPRSKNISVPRKPINILKTQDPKYKKMSRKALLEVLMKEKNPYAQKSIIVDVESDSKEIDETYDAIRKDQLPVRKRMFLWKTNKYTNDQEFNKPRVRTHLSRGEGTQKTDEIIKSYRFRLFTFNSRSLQREGSIWMDGVNPVGA